VIDSRIEEEMKALASRYPRPESALMPALSLVQRDVEGRYISKETLRDVAQVLGVPWAKAQGVLTYYTMYNQKSVGKYHIQVDVNISAMLMGADALMDRLRTKHRLEVGRTTRNGMFSLTAVQDLGSSGTCPVVCVNDRYYENMSVEKLDLLMDSLRKGEMPDWKEESHYGSECNILMRRRAKENSCSIKTYLEDGGYQSLAKAIQMKPEEVMAEVKASNLRGRGGAGFPTGMKWGFLTRKEGQPVYLICNADEGEPGTFKDRQIMEYDPHLLLEGLAISAYAIHAKKAFIYIRGEFGWIADILEKAIAEARDAGKIGEHVRGSGIECDIIVHRGCGAYVCGEETALIESLEGKRGNPRIKPPFPAEAGLYGCPTIVNNVETLACVPYIVEHGAAEFRKIGTPNNFGPKIFGVSGHVIRPGAYEYPLGTPLQTILDAAGGVQGKMKAVIVGGLSVPILTADETDGLKLDYDSCLKKGTMLGSGGIIVMNETVDVPQVAIRAIRFYAHESCGQCTPCREGSRVIVGLLDRITKGYGQKGDVERILRLCQTIVGSTLCPTGDAFAKPIEAMVLKCRREFEERIK